MPIFVYSEPNTGETKEIVQSVHEEHSYSEKGVKWNRIFTVPQASIDSKTPVTEQEFLTKTANKRGTLGNLMDASKESSEKRKKIQGEDGVLRKWHENYSKTRHGKKHISYYKDFPE